VIGVRIPAAAADEETDAEEYTSNAANQQENEEQPEFPVAAVATLVRKVRNGGSEICQIACRCQIPLHEILRTENTPAQYCFQVLGDVAVAQLFLQLRAEVRRRRRKVRLHSQVSARAIRRLPLLAGASDPRD